MTDLEKKEKELANLEEELQGYAREIQERERALQIAEHQAAKRADIDRDDYLFDVINRHQASYKPVVVEVPTPQTKVDSPLDCLTAFMATLAAVFTLTILVLILI